MDETYSAAGGRPGKTYWLNEGQAILVTIRSDAPKAPEVRKELIDVFMAYRRGQLVQAPAGYVVPKDSVLIDEDAWTDVWTAVQAMRPHIDKTDSSFPSKKMLVKRRDLQFLSATVRALKESRKLPAA